MGDIKCENCAWRAKFDEKPKSFLGRLWKWHTGFCPGWKAYLASLPEERRQQVIQQYS